MPTKTFHKINILFISTCVFGLLTACTPNPIKTTKPKIAAEFLVTASKVAQDKLKINGETGYYYGECMNGKGEKDLCNKLYQAMVNYAKTTKAFNTLSVNHLTDPSVFAKLAEDYERERFINVA